MKAALLGLLLVVMPAAARVEQVPISLFAHAVCEAEHGTPCVVTRGDIIIANIALHMAGEAIKARDEAIDALKDENQELRDALQDALRDRKLCAKVEKIPVPGRKS